MAAKRVLVANVVVSENGVAVLCPWMVDELADLTWDGQFQGLAIELLSVAAGWQLPFLRSLQMLVLHLWMPGDHHLPKFAGSC